MAGWLVGWPIACRAHTSGSSGRNATEAQETADTVRNAETETS